MKKSTKIDQELEEISPFLAEMRKGEDAFKIPDNYFDYLSESVLEQVKLEPQLSINKKKEKTPWYAFLFHRAAVGSMATLAVILAVVLLTDQSQIVDQSLANISSEEFSEYVSTHIEEFEVNDFLEADLLGNIREIELEEQEIEQYLEENIDELDAATLEQLL